MQDLSASDLMSLELGFQTAREDNDDEEATGASEAHQSRRQPDEEQADAVEVAAGQDEDQASNETSANTSSNNSSKQAERRESEMSDEQETRRMSCTGAERANKWRLNGAARKRDNTTQELRTNDEEETGECRRAGSISQPAGGTETNANNEQHFQLDPSAEIAKQQPQQSEASRANVERQCGARRRLASFTSVRLHDSSGSMQRRPEIRIHVDTCGDASFERFESALDRAVAPPPSLSSSSLNLTSLDAGLTLTTTTTTTNYWADQSLTSARSAGNMQSSEQDLLLLSVQPSQDAGSLSDGAYKLTKYCRPNKGPGTNEPLSGLQFNKGRFEKWKRNNKLITNVHENPINLHLDYLNRIEEFKNEMKGCSSIQQRGQVKEAKKSVREQTTQTTEDDQPNQQQPNDLNNYANNLSHLYRKNRESMDSSNDFRALLYNIICCLLVQDDQVLATVSVGKMLDVIRTHLDSASRVYAETSNQLLSNLTQQMSQRQATGEGSPLESCSQTSHSSSSSGMSAETLAAASLVPQHQLVSQTNRRVDFNADEEEEFSAMLANQLVPSSASAASNHEKQQQYNHSQKPVNFRRISSVSFNDEQLIKDLRDEQRAAEGRRSGSLSTESSGHPRDPYTPSPWAYRELSDRRQSGAGCGADRTGKLNSAGSSSHTTAHYTSQSSLEQTINLNSDGHQNDLMNDSGNGTMCDSQVVSDYAGYSHEAHRYRRRASLQSADRAVSLCSESFRVISMPRARHDFREPLPAQQRRLSDFKPAQQPSYMSTDDYLSSTNNHQNQRTSFYDDENSSTLQKCDFAFHHGARHRDGPANDDDIDDETQLDEHGRPQIDVAGRRAELEWTLNKLINIELKLTWLTSKDTLRRAIRKIGVPNEIRGKVWLILIDQMIGNKYDAPKLIELASQTIEEAVEKLASFDDETQAILKQIELDVNRTMPGHRLFDDGAEGGVKLRRILVAYSIHVNRAIAYCQGFNFIVALLLSVFEGDETKALRGFICIVDHIFPSKYYFDHYLTGARADQFLLADFICDQLIKSPTMAERKMVEGVTSSITLNWFISLFHGAVPTLTRLTILDHFMLEGVKALFRFTMAILYLAFQVTPPSSCDIFTTIRQTAKDLYDIKLLLSIVDQIKLPKDSYFAIRRSFYMVQSSFNSDQFYMQTLSNEAGKSLVANKPLSCQQLASSATKPPALSLISSASFLANATSSFCNHHQQQQQQQQSHTIGWPATGISGANQFTFKNSVCQDLVQKPRTRISSDRSKICVQSIGKLGRSHLRIIDANARANERSLMSPLRNCVLIGISNCGKNLVIARQSSKRNFRSFKEQDLTFHIHEISTEIFDGFYLEESQQALIITHPGEIFKIDCRKCLEDQKLAKTNYLDGCTETLLLRDTGSSQLAAEHEKVKLRLSTMDSLTNLLWIYVECEGSFNELHSRGPPPSASGQQARLSPRDTSRTAGRSSNTPERSPTIMSRTATRFRLNNPFLDSDWEASSARDSNNNNTTGDHHHQQETPDGWAGEQEFGAGLGPTSDNHQQASPTAALANKPRFSRKIIIVDMITFDLFSVFAVHPNFGEITNLRASLVAFCQLSNPMSNQFSTRIVQIGPTGRYEQLLSFSDVADFMVNLPDSFKRKYHKQSNRMAKDGDDQTSGQHLHQQQQQRYSSLRRFLTHSISFSSSRGASLGGGPTRPDVVVMGQSDGDENNARNETGTNSTLTRYYRSLMRSYSSNNGPDRAGSPSPSIKDGSERNKLQPDLLSSSSSSSISCDTKLVQSKKQVPKLIQDGALRSIISSSFGDFSELSETNYIPVNMAFIFRNGKIALFEFTESYAIHTREAQLDRYDYSRVVDVTKNGEDFIVTILTVCDKLIKVII